jgi:hypothetical protein
VHAQISWVGPMLELHQNALQPVTELEEEFLKMKMSEKSFVCRFRLRDMPLYQVCMYIIIVKAKLKL